MTDINCDMGESFSIYSAGNDEEIMPLIDIANVACGFHASDPNHMRKTVELAKKNNVKVGAHPSLPDLQGFGRREMKLQRHELKNFIKPHGALYGMASKDEEVAHAIADAVAVFNVSIFGMVNTFHEKVYKERGLDFIAEFYADLDYDPEGKLIISKGKNKPYDTELAVERCLRAISEKKVKNTGGTDTVVGCDTICVHSDTPNAIEIIQNLSKAIKQLDK